MWFNLESTELWFDAAKRCGERAAGPERMSTVGSSMA
jgi:hypothetical protein